MEKWTGVPVTRPEDILGESPVWRENDGCLLWVDVRRALLRTLNLMSGDVSAQAVDAGATGIVLDSHGAAWVLARDRLLRQRTDGAIEPAGWTFALPDADHRLNEAKCDQTGALWLGTMRDFGLTPTGALHRLDARGQWRMLRRDVSVPNALGFLPDGTWAYFADTRRGSIERARFDPHTGTTGDWQPFVDAAAAPGKPDGLAIDADGYLWNARFGGGCVARFSPHGRLDGLAALPVSQPTSCVFGGPALTTLFVTSARQKLDNEQLRREPLAGSVFAIETGVRDQPPGLLDAAFLHTNPARIEPTRIIDITNKETT